MSDMFACPHCGAGYPRKPVLVGKVVRCTKCRQPFMLRADGIADAVVEVAPPPAAPADGAQPTPAVETAAQPAVKTGTQTIAVTPSLRPATQRVNKPGTPTASGPEPAAPGATKPPLPGGKPPTQWTALEGLADKPTAPAKPSGRMTVSAPAPAAPGSSQQSGRTRAAASANPTGAAPPEAGAAGAESPPGEAQTKTGRKDFTSQQEEARRVMSAKLASVMSKLQPETAAGAADKERIDPLAPLAPPTRTKGGSSRQTRIKPATDSLRKLPPAAILSGEGERAGRQQRTILLLCASLLVVALVVWAVVTHEGPFDRALTLYASPTPGAVFPERAASIQRRCLLWAKVPGGQQSAPFEGLRDRHFGAPHAITRESIADALSKITAMALIDHQQVWVDQGRAQDATTLIAGLVNPGPDDLTAILTRAGIKSTLESVFAAKLAAAGLDDEGQDLLLALIAGETERGVNAIGAHLLSGDVPQKIEWLTFTGDHGDFLRYDGFHYQYQDRKYRGHLVRFIGAGPDWPTEQNVWRVMDVDVAGP